MPRLVSRVLARAPELFAKYASKQGSSLVEATQDAALELVPPLPHPDLDEQAPALLQTNSHEFTTTSQHVSKSPFDDYKARVFARPETNLKHLKGCLAQWSTQ